jgi:hypothetical protein
MTRRIRFITIVGVALVLAPPAFAKGQPVETPQWQQALMARSEGLNKSYGLGQHDPAIRALELRSEGLNRQYGLGVYSGSEMFRALNARERALEAKSQVQTTSAIDAREEAFGAKRDAQLAATSGPDAFERTVIASTRETVPVVADDRFRIDPTANPVPVETTSGREIEWPQVGVGLGIGLLLGLCLVLAVRYTRIRPLAH